MEKNDGREVVEVNIKATRDSSTVIYKLQWPDGHTYEGAQVDGERSGTGKEIWPDGD